MSNVWFPELIPVISPHQWEGSEHSLLVLLCIYLNDAAIILQCMVNNLVISLLKHYFKTTFLKIPCKINLYS